MTLPEPITIDGKAGTVVYINDDFKPVPKNEATLARVLFNDGSTAFYSVAKK